MTFERTAEWDAFGPWILPVRTGDDVPRAFRDHPFRFDGDSTIVKVPRNVARRDADPSMHLYDRVLLVDAGGIEVLTREEDGYTGRSIGARSIAAVEYGSDLLDGWLIIYSRDGDRIEFPVSGTAGDMVAALTRQLLDAATGPIPHPTPSQELTRDALEEDDVALVNAFRPVARSTDGLSVQAVLGGARVASKESFLKRVRKGQPRRSGAIIATSDHQIVIVTRHHPISYGPKPDLSLRHIFIVRSSVDAVTISAHPLAFEADLLGVVAGPNRIEIAIPQGLQDAEALRATLAERSELGRRAIG